MTAVCTLTGLLLGMAAQVCAGLTEVVTTMPAVLAGMLTTAVTGPSASGVALGVCLVGWTPYAAQAAALLEQERASGHSLASLSFGAGPGYLLRHHLLPAVVPPLLRNALMRMPTTVLVLASLGFLGPGEQPPVAEWGRLLSENQPYAELEPWIVLGPACVLVLLSVLALSSMDTATARSSAPVRCRASRIPCPTGPNALTHTPLSRPAGRRGP
ncbi:ABC transporter permease subunit [Streptomyces griseiscabiei]|uniref:ABC transporter permease subunit n=1 Tax=Streptomyces griseiscabiei TaxID=2993540 RepID=A0ABU4L7N1_9ACTN|nr:ABC transporter permease subunit [Streptomyces griseiscabiei]MDX2911506.1 ABC transporter permease subunit [Streptomyces griseiscabiei]